MLPSTKLLIIPWNFMFLYITVNVVMPSTTTSPDVCFFCILLKRLKIVTAELIRQACLSHSNSLSRLAGPLLGETMSRFSTEVKYMLTTRSVSNYN